MRFRDIPVLAQYIAINLPLDLLMDSIIYGTIEKVNVIIADLLRENIFRHLFEYKSHHPANIKADVESELWHNFWQDYTQDMVLASLSGHLFSRLSTHYKSFVDGSKNILSYINVDRLLPAHFSEGSNIESWLNIMEDIHLEGHLVEAFIKPYIDILLLDRPKEACLIKIDLDSEMMMHLALYIWTSPITLYNYAYKYTASLLANDENIHLPYDPATQCSLYEHIDAMDTCNYNDENYA